MFFFLRLILTLLFFVNFAFASSTSSHSVIGEKITQCANKFIGTPYDTNPIGEYVFQNVIIYDEKVDCMYFVFRCTEIALSNKENSPEQIALSQRFHTLGIISNGVVLNYQDRFSYADDIILSSKWGIDVSPMIGKISKIEGTRGVSFFNFVAKNDINLQNFKNGDIIFFVKAKEKRVADEVVGHLGFIEVKNDNVYLIHASGVKKPETNGSIKKVLLSDYLNQTKFIGIVVKRF